MKIKKYNGKLILLCKWNMKTMKIKFGYVNAIHKIQCKGNIYIIYGKWDNNAINVENTINNKLIC